MTSRPRWRFLLLFLLLLGAVAGRAAPPAAPDASADRVRWFREAKYGLFIHWGLYAIPAGYWDGRQIPSAAEWIMRRGPIPVAEYQKLAAEFNPVRFDADAWAQFAVDAGMKYVVITAKHHDGFALFKSAASAYNVVDATPFHRDIIRELGDACRRRGLKFGVYYSQAQDWHEPGGGGNDWDFSPDAEKDRDGSFDRYLRTKAEPQLRELLTGYGPLALIWFDTPMLMDRGDRAARLLSLVRTLQPDCLVNGRLGTPGDYRSTTDNFIPHESADVPWEVPATTNGSWGYRRDDQNWKSAAELVFKLVDVVAKGGNLLLNVGPDAEGVIPAASADHLRRVGAWLARNGDAVYGAERSPFGEEFGEPAQHLKNFQNEPVFLPFRGWRCTAKPGRLYFTIFEPERRQRVGYFALPAFRNRIRSIRSLTDPAHPEYEVKTTPDGRRYFNPRIAGSDPLGETYVVEYEGDRIER